MFGRLTSSVSKLPRHSSRIVNLNNFRSSSVLSKIPQANTQTYISRSRSPYLNLSIEHYLLTKSPPESTILFLYTNEPSIIIGRNQNPWVECNHAVVRQSALQPWIVRRRSGGGTVWHDEGNVNYSVICPTAKFDRNKHAEMVVRALRSLDVEGVKVNERHDIVMESPTSDSPFKISGSAYKLTRLRSLHHGTCLLSSPNLEDIGKYLQSPAKKYIKARGVDSVRSAIANVHVGNDDFEKAVVGQFQDMYESVETTIVGDEQADVPEIAKGVKELSSADWIYGQTPQFHFSYPSLPITEELENQQQHMPLNLAFVARNGIITRSLARYLIAKPGSEEDLASAEPCSKVDGLTGTKIHSVMDWNEILLNWMGVESHELSAARKGGPFTRLMNNMFVVNNPPQETAFQRKHQAGVNESGV